MIHSYRVVCVEMLWSKQQCSNHIPDESDLLPHAHAQAAKTYYKHQDSRIRKLKFKDKDFRNSNIQDLPKDIKIIKTKVVKRYCYQAFKMMHSMSMSVPRHKIASWQRSKVNKEKI
nr:hypothetical protein [Tanacetum cinerariifolium]